MSDRDTNDPDRQGSPESTGGRGDEDPTSVMGSGGEPTRPMEPTPASGSSAGGEPPPRGGSQRGASPPSSGGISTGLAIAVALLLGIIGLLVGALVFGGDDDGDEQVGEATEGDEALSSQLDEVTSERDELQAQVEELMGEVADLESQLQEVTDERDELQAGAGDLTPAPDVVGRPVEDVRDTADENGWTLLERTAEGDGDEAGTVTEQSPDPDTPMADGSILVVDVVEETGEDDGDDGDGGE